jgi:hypothetical protein
MEDQTADQSAPERLSLKSQLDPGRLYHPLQHRSQATIPQILRRRARNIDFKAVDAVAHGEGSW